MNNSEKQLYLYTAHGNDLVRIGIQDDSGRGSFVEGPPLNAVASAYAILDSAAHAYAEGALGRCPDWLAQAVRLLAHSENLLGPKAATKEEMQAQAHPCPHCKHPVVGDPMGDGGYCSDWCCQTHAKQVPAQCPEWQVAVGDVRCTEQVGHDGPHVFPAVDGGAA